MVKKKMKKDMKCCDGSSVAGHIFAILGMYVLTWGLLGTSNVGIVLQSPIFWGLFLLGMAKCVMSNAKKTC